MSPITIDIYTSRNSRKPDAHAMLWLNKLVDNEPTTVTIPIWTTDNAQRLTQNYIERPDDQPELTINEIGSMTFECCFQPGMDNDHAHFATDNDSRETFESWQACRGEGIRGDTVHTEIGPVVDALHQQSVREMREDLAKTDKGHIDIAEGSEDVKTYTDKYGKDWRGVFEAGKKELGGGASAAAGPKIYRAKPGMLTIAEQSDGEYDSDTSTSPSDTDHSDSSYQHVTQSQYHEPDSHVEAKEPEQTSKAHENDGDQEGGKRSGPLAALKTYRNNQRSMHRRHQGLMQWKPMRSLAFAKDEAKFGARKLRNKVRLGGREPDVETEA